MTFHERFLGSLLGGGCFALLSIACSSNEAAAPSPPSNECELGATKCEGNAALSCETASGGTKWSAPLACEGDARCRDGACTEPTERMGKQMASVNKLAEQLADNSAWHEPVDLLEVKAKGRQKILDGDGSDGVFLDTAWGVMNAYRQGHQSFQLEKGCGKTISYQQYSRFGVCGRPSANGLVVTYATPANRLGLNVADTIVGAGEVVGEALFEASYARSVCGSVFPSASGRRNTGAASFFGNVPSGTKLRVVDASGKEREVVVPEASDSKLMSCHDPFVRSPDVFAEATTRPDGVAVIRLPRFVPYDKPLPTSSDPAVMTQFEDDFRKEIVKVFETVKSAKAIVWDTRGNTGGITQIGLSIVAGFPDAKATNLSYCRTRVPGSSPPSFSGPKYASYSVTPGGPFAYVGKVAIVTDGTSYSAGDYFPYAAIRAANVPVIGASTAGAFGGGRAPIEIEGPPALKASYDPTGCFDAASGAPLEGNPPPPTVAVDYDAASLAAGKDPLIEAAVKALGL